MPSIVDPAKARLPQLGGFVYEPLDTSGSAIRLLQILPGSRDSNIQCEISHRPLVNNGHVCLSYMWGSNEFSRTILVNGRELLIHRNLWCFLAAARRMDIFEPLWIDAICIDQQSLKERNHQVQLMTEIYRQAKHVIIWPKDYVGDTSEARVSSLAKSTLGLFTKGTTWSQQQHINMILKPDMLTKYWNRLWIVQEIAMAKQRYILHEPFLIEWSQAVQCYQTIDLKKNIAAASFGKLMHLVNNLQVIREENSGEAAGRRSATVELLRLCSKRECQDLRDRWYGVLGLIPGAADFRVDYEIDPATLVLDALTHVQSVYTLFSALPSVCQALACCFELRCRIMCLKCAQVHPKVATAPLATETDNREKKAPQLLVVLRKDEVASWKFAGTAMLTACSVCSDEFVRWGWGRDAYVSTVRVATNQLWCFPMNGKDRAMGDTYRRWRSPFVNYSRPL